MIMVIMVIMTTRGNINDYNIGIETIALMEKVALDIMMVIMIIKMIKMMIVMIFMMIMTAPIHLLCLWMGWKRLLCPSRSLGNQGFNISTIFKEKIESVTDRTFKF